MYNAECLCVAPLLDPSLHSPWHGQHLSFGRLLVLSQYLDFPSSPTDTLLGRIPLKMIPSWFKGSWLGLGLRGDQGRVPTFPWVFSRRWQAPWGPVWNLNNGEAILRVMSRKMGLRASSSPQTPAWFSQRRQDSQSPPRGLGVRAKHTRWDLGWGKCKVDPPDRERPWQDFGH